MNNVQTLIEALNKAEKDIEKYGLEALKEEFTKFFQKAPEVNSIYWTQYTPYFNDGDACTFHVNDPEFNYDDEDADKLEEVINDFEDLFYQNKIKSIFLAAFGDHVSVEASKEGFKVRKYNHD